MRDAVHGEGVEPYFFFHRAALRPARLNAGTGRTCCIPAEFGKAKFSASALSAEAVWRYASRT
jgi:hypothetical protein